MKKFILLLYIIISIITLYGDDTFKKHHFNVFGGFTQSELSHQNIKDSFDFSTITCDRLHDAFNVGFSFIKKGRNLDDDFDPDMYAFFGREIGIRYVERGFKENRTYTEGTETWKVKESVKSSYIDIFYKAKFMIGGEAPLFKKNLEVQPYIGVGVSFLADTNMEKDTYPSRTDIPLMFGFDFIFANRILIGFELNYGLLNVFNEKVYDKYPGHFETAHIYMGYLFGFNID